MNSPQLGKCDQNSVWSIRHLWSLLSEWNARELKYLSLTNKILSVLWQRGQLIIYSYKYHSKEPVQEPVSLGNAVLSVINTVYTGVQHSARVPALCKPVWLYDQGRIESNHFEYRQFLFPTDLPIPQWLLSLDMFQVLHWFSTLTC